MTLKTVVPSTSCSGCLSSWFNDTDYSDYIDTDTTSSYSVGAWDGECMQFQPPRVCVQGTDPDSTKVHEDKSSCVEGLNICLVSSTSSTANTQYSAVLGLGMPEVTSYKTEDKPVYNDEDSFQSWMYQNYLQNLLEPTACFNYYFNNTDYPNASPS